MDFGKIIKKVKQIHVARSLIILYTLFISLFSLDTEFGIGFLVHLLPTFILVSMLIVSWKKPKIAGALFILAGIGTMIVFNTYRELVTFLIISCIPIGIGILFFFSKNPKH